MVLREVVQKGQDFGRADRDCVEIDFDPGGTGGVDAEGGVGLCGVECGSEVVRINSSRGRG